MYKVSGLNIVRTSLRSKVLPNASAMKPFLLNITRAQPAIIRTSQLLFSTKNSDPKDDVSKSTKKSDAEKVKKQPKKKESLKSQKEAEAVTKKISVESEPTKVKKVKKPKQGVTTEEDKKIEEAPPKKEY